MRASGFRVFSPSFGTAHPVIVSFFGIMRIILGSSIMLLLDHYYRVRVLLTRNRAKCCFGLSRTSGPLSTMEMPDSRLKGFWL